ncbi:AMP-binding enzyme [Micromonospora saelicesensis]|uniref:AMP-binding enzyme n=1 Tax=Micromonospora saelicesensis TaxID=285676 RepID=UPI000DD5E6AB|nr:hypothetical protein [Micromonospora saelicesensis]
MPRSPDEFLSCTTTSGFNHRSVDRRVSGAGASGVYRTSEGTAASPQHINRSRPDDVTGEAVHAYVVPAAGRVPDAERLRAVVAQTLGEPSVPRTIQSIDRVPVAPSGKPDKRALSQPWTGTAT